MSTNDFVQQINPENLSHIVTIFFDEIMVLYNLIGKRKDLTISADMDSSEASFTIMMNSEEDAVSLCNSLNDTYFSVYDDKYLIQMQVSERTVSTIIKKAIS